jgi:hypothetical protein
MYIDLDGGGTFDIGHKVMLTRRSIYLNIPTASKEFTAPSISTHDVCLGGVICVAWSLLGTVFTGVIKSNLLAMGPAVVFIIGIVQPPVIGDSMYIGGERRDRGAPLGQMLDFGILGFDTKYLFRLVALKGQQWSWSAQPECHGL